MEYVYNFFQIFIIGVLLGVGIKFANQRLVAHYEGRTHLTFRRQLIQIGGIILAVLLVILFMPFGDVLRGQLLSLFGLIISATIALSSTTLVGNAMAGIMLKSIGSCRPGNYITVGDHFGRISEMDLLHTEIQTEERDLTTLPNLYLITNPVRVMRESGTVLFVELSLGYDVSRHVVEELLVEAAKACSLESPFVQIRNLGDYSVTYRISGLLREINRLLDKRRELRRRTMDALHAEGIEIVSPTFMNTRSLSKTAPVIPDGAESAETAVPKQSTDALVFDKAEKAESLERLREKLADIDTRISSAKNILEEPGNEQTVLAAEREIEDLEKRKNRIQSLIDRKEAKISAS
ncbi:MAG: mechanosensitive ion channel domain-containing protein [Woeseiaceae bacterium]